MAVGFLLVLLLLLAVVSLALSAAQAWALQTSSNTRRHLIVWAVSTLVIGSRYIAALAVYRATPTEMFLGALFGIGAPACVFAAALALGAWRARAKSLRDTPFGQRVLSLVGVHLAVLIAGAGLELFVLLWLSDIH